MSSKQVAILVLFCPWMSALCSLCWCVRFSWWQCQLAIRFRPEDCLHGLLWTITSIKETWLRPLAFIAVTAGHVLMNWLFSPALNTRLFFLSATGHNSLPALVTPSLRSPSQESYFYCQLHTGELMKHWPSLKCSGFKTPVLRTWRHSQFSVPVWLLFCAHPLLCSSLSLLLIARWK